MSNKPWLARIFVLLFAHLAVTGAAQDKTGWPFPVAHSQLKNGLEVILSEDNSLPLVSVVMAYHAGSIHEQPGKTGLAYLLENMMFMGSLNVGPMQHIGFISRIGGEPNASTTEDITYFYQTVPSNQLALVLWLESDRMRALEIDASKVEQAKQSLLDEILQRKAAEPYLDSLLAFNQLLYPDFAHNHDILGREEDIRSLTADDVRNFYANYYVPNNATLVIVGNINSVKTQELVEKYFETIPSGKELPVFLPPKPPDRREVVQVFQENLAPSPAFHLGYRIAPPYARDYYALVVLDYLLLKGKSSRLYRKLVKKDSLAFYLSGGIEKRKDIAALKIFVMNNNERMVDLCQKGIFSEVGKLREDFVSEDELLKAKNMLKQDYEGRFSTLLDRAMFLAEMFFLPGGLDSAAQELGKYLRISPFEIRVMVNRYLLPENMVILNVKTR
jgi:predicted Zn-dependent peptidase